MISKRYKYNGKPEFFLNKIQLEAKDNLEAKIRNGIYQSEKINCIVCGVDNFELIAEKDRYGLKHEVGTCRECGLVYANPRLTQDSYNQFYDIEYRKLYIGKESVDSSFFQAQEEHGTRIYKYIRNKSESEISGKKVLEVGCGSGGILSAFKKNGCIVKGVDLGSEYLNFGKEQYGLDLIQGSISSVDISYKPDIIIYSHVMEHILDPNNELQLLKEYCHSNTIIYIEVPGIKVVKDPMIALQNAHVFYFSSTTLKNLFIKNGFKSVHCDDFVRSIFVLGSEELSKNFVNDYRDVLKQLSKKERKIKRSIVRNIVNLKKYFFPKPMFK